MEQEQVPSTSYSSPPGVFARPDLPGGLAYWTGSDWDPRQVASTWTRVWALAIDLVLTSILTLPLVIGLPLITPNNASSDSSTLPVLLLVQILYFTVSYVAFGRSLGMWAAGLTVVSISATGARLTLGSGLLRALVLSIAFVIPFLALAWLIWTASSRTRRGPQDLAAGSVVLRGTAQPHATQSDVAAGQVAQPPTPSGRRTAAIFIAAFSILLLVLAAVYLDSRLKAAEMANLLSATQESELVMQELNSDMQSINDEYQPRAELCGSSEPCVFQVLDEWTAASSSMAKEYLIPLQESALNVEAVSPLPWHGDITSARDAYLDHVNAWLERVEYESAYEKGVSTESESASISNEISRTWTVAERRYRDVTILLAPDDIAVAVEAVFRD